MSQDYFIFLSIIGDPKDTLPNGIFVDFITLGIKTEKNSTLPHILLLVIRARMLSHIMLPLENFREWLWEKGKRKVISSYHYENASPHIDFLKYFLMRFATLKIQNEYLIFQTLIRFNLSA